MEAGLRLKLSKLSPWVSNRKFRLEGLCWPLLTVLAQGDQDLTGAQLKRLAMQLYTKARLQRRSKEELVEVWL